MQGRDTDMEGWIKIHRSIEEWEWEGDPLMYYFWVRLLVRVNYEDTEWKGITVPRGSMITSLANLAHDMHLSVKQVRTYTERLSKRGQIVTETTNKWTLITICKYEDYQGCTETKGQTERKREGTQNVNKRANTTDYDSDSYGAFTETKGQTKGTLEGIQNVNQRATNKEDKNKEYNISVLNAPAYTREDWRFISSVRQSLLGFDKDRIAEYKKELFRAEVEALAGKVGMTQDQKDAFVSWWTEHSPKSDKIKADCEATFDTENRMRIWVDRDRPRYQQQPQTQKSNIDRFEERQKFINEFFNNGNRQQYSAPDEQ